MQNCLDSNFIYKIINLLYIIRKVLKILQIYSPESDMKKVAITFITKILSTNIAILLFLKQYLRCCHWQKYRNTKLDNTLNLIVEALKSNKSESDEVQRYKQIRNKLAEHNSILIRENRISLPQSLRKKAIEIAYQGNLGICKVKSLLRENVYWPGLDADVNEFISRCIPCQANLRIPPPEPVKMSTLPDKSIRRNKCGFLWTFTKRGKVS